MCAEAGDDPDAHQILDHSGSFGRPSRQVGERILR